MFDFFKKRKEARLWKIFPGDAVIWDEKEKCFEILTVREKVTNQQIKEVEKIRLKITEINFHSNGQTKIRIKYHSNYSVKDIIIVVLTFELVMALLLILSLVSKVKALAT